MAATVEIIRMFGAAGATHTQIDSGNTRCKCADNGTADTNTPVPIPAAGSNYAFWASTRLLCTVTPAGAINNIKWYTDGADAFGTGVTCVVGTVAMTNASDTGYVQATAAGGCGVQLLAANYATLSPTTPVDCFGKTSGSPQAVAGSISNPDTGTFGDLVVYQLQVGTTAGPGLAPPSVTETFTWQYDET